MRFFCKKIIKKILSFVFVIFVLAFCLFGAYAIEREYVYPIENKENVCFFADKYGIERAMVFAVIKTESNFNANAESKAGAIGLMQINVETGKYIANLLERYEYDLKDEKTNIEFGCYYLSYLFGRFSEEKTAIAAYNAGEGRVRAWLKDERYSEDKERLKTVPYRETEEYLKKIYKSLGKYRKLYGKLLDKVENFE